MTAGPAPPTGSGPTAVPAGPLPAAPATTLGVEEEFFLLRSGGAAATVAPELLRALDGAVDLQAEFMQFQVESTSQVRTDLHALAGDLTRGRRALAAAAGELGALLVASGTPPFRVPGRVAVTPSPRYREMLDRWSRAGEDVSCATHVHVGVPSRDLGVAVVDRVRGWLPVLLALGANSPFWRGRDTGWASYRHAVLRAWPTAVLPPRFRDAAAWDEGVAERIAEGAALDRASVYWFARLSPRYPTVEIRVADAALTTAEAVLIAGLCRALVVTALREAVAGAPPPELPDAALAASVVAAARRGLGGLLLDPWTRRWLPGRDALPGLLAHVAPALEEAGDAVLVRGLLEARLTARSGAARQRALRRGTGPGGLVAALAAATLADGGVGYLPPTPRVPEG
ncbi:carboxylate-amine ligase [Geodermatophilus marinus]|uniref:carboxylate-amine ligase n=1 Tax=Geodermatophilus sp. LHW52908 TaxID=2303986 RepID=UPI0013142760|nr:YbdK family carboxylate-amine ligase [Geodermatophilus sp. LHW52908]